MAPIFRRKSVLFIGFSMDEAAAHQVHGWTFVVQQEHGPHARVMSIVRDRLGGHRDPSGQYWPYVWHITVEVPEKDGVDNR